MAGQQTTADEIIAIELELKTNFARTLTNASAQFNKFADVAATVSKQSIGSLESLNRQLNVTLGSMFSTTASEMQAAVSEVSKLTAELEESNKKFVSNNLKATDRLRTQYETVLRLLKQNANVMAEIDRKRKLPTKDESGKFVRRFSPGEVKQAINLRKNLQEAIGVFHDMVGDSHKQLVVESVGVIKQNVNNLTTASVKSLEVMGRTADDVLKRIRLGKFAVQNLTDTPQLIKKSELFGEAKEGRDAMSSLYRDQAARLTVAVKSRKAIDSLIKMIPVNDPKTMTPEMMAENDKLRIQLLEAGKAARLAEEQVRRSMVGMRPSIQMVNAAVKDLNLELVALGQRAGTTLKRNIISSGSIENVFGKLMGSYGEQILYATRNTDTAFVNAARDGRTLTDQINKIVIALKQQNRELEILHRTGFLPETEYVTAKKNIADRLDQIKKLDEGVKQVARDMKQLSAKDFAKIADLSQLNKSTAVMETSQSKFLSMGARVTGENFTRYVSSLKQAQAAQESFDKDIIASQKKIAEAAKFAEDVRILASTQANQQIKNKMMELHRFIKSSINQMTIEMTMAMDKKVDLSRMEAPARAYARAVQENIARTVPDPGMVKERFAAIHKLYDDFTLYQQKTMNKWFVGEGTKEKAAGMYQAIRHQIVAYREELVRLVAEYKKLKEVQAAGMGDANTAAQLKRTKDSIDTMRVSMMELGRINDQAGKKMELIQGKSVAGALRAGWEMIRNFRWQVAAVAYLAYAAINQVKRFVTGVFDEIYDFRKQVMSLAASFTYQMLGDLKTNFDTAVGFARNLMVQMQLVAAKTALSMEDMTNLVRTFAQAGIIPKGKEDLERIAAIGTAIQAVTEGMANQGVQMKQELNALILGRQRATDSLAMMFKFMGVNIKEIMKKAREEGTDMLTLFSDALKPFNEMMGRMKDEWGAVKNRMELAWEVMKRFALEGFLENLTKSLSNTIKVYFDEATGELTNAGKEIAQIIRTIYEAGRVITSSFVSSLGASLGILNQLLNTAHDLKIALTGAAGTSAEFEGNYRGVLSLFKEILQVVWLINNTIAAMIAVIKLPIQTLISLVEGVRGTAQWLGGKFGSLFTGKESEQAKAGVARLQKAWEGVAKASADVWNLPANAQKGLDDIEKTFTEIRNMSKETKNNITSLATFKLPIDIGALTESAKAMEKHFETKGISEGTISTLAAQMGSYTKSVVGQIKQVSKANAEVEAAIEEASKKYGISAEIIRAVAWKESRYNPNAVSKAGAQGIMQIMPETGKELGLEDPFNIKQNVDAGAKYLKQMLDRYKGDLKKALAAYNAGPGNVDKAGGNVPKIAETMEYVRDLTGETDEVIKSMGINFGNLVTKGPAKFAEEARNAKEEFFKTEEMALKGIAALNQLFWDADLGIVDLSESDRKFRMEQLSGLQEQVARIRVYYALVDAEEAEKNRKWQEAEDNKNARQQREFEKLKRSLTGKPMTVGEKYADWYADEKEKLDQFIVTNKIVGKHADELWKAFSEGSADYWKKLWKESEESYDAFENKISSHKLKTPFESIRLEFEKLKDELTTLAREKSWSPDMVSGMKELMGKYQEERIAIEHINQGYDLQLRNIDLAIKKNNYFAGSYSPILQQQAELNNVVLTYAKDVTEVEKSISDLDYKWKDLNGNWKNTEGVEYIKQMRESYVESLKYMQMAYEREFFKKQHPLWNELVEMSKSWADGMTDALADFVDQTKTAKEAINDLTKSIQRDVLKAVIKNYITNPIMGILGSGEPGSPTPMQRMSGTPAPNAAAMEAAKQAAKTAGAFGTGGMGPMDSLIASGKPVPVFIVADPNQILVQSAEATKGATEEVKSAVDATTQAINAQTDEERGIFSQILSALMNLHGFMAGGGLAGGQGGGFGGLFNSIMGMFGGGSTETGMTTNTPNSWTNWGAQTGGWGMAAEAGGGSAMESIIGSGMTYAFADGGKITEQIVGRGLKSGASYTFGERTKYGENEIVAPMDKLAQQVSQSNGMAVHINMPVSLQAIDTQSGVDFLMKNNYVLEANMIKAIRNNRRIRDAILGK